VKMRIASLSLLTIACLVLAVVPATADTVFYSNGAPNFTTDAWTINSGFSVSDSYLSGFPSGTDLSNLSFAVWQLPGDALTSVQLDHGTAAFGTDLGSSVLTNPTFDNQGTNQYGYNVGVYTFNFADNTLGECRATTCWITLSNAVTTGSNPIYWDENSGPSSAFENTLGSIPSEAFTLSGNPSPGTTPEPSSIMLFGSGVLGLAGVLRRKLTR
jgi:hypothetical protein